ncbi:MAG: ABC transporter permease [Cyclobacteriaceae bacterium]|nr:ABC transporter permease [Cyclobacteriaceae bacterium]
MTDSEEYVIEPANGGLLNLKEIVQYHELLYFFSLRDIMVKYKQTVLGVLWAVLQPLLLMLIFTMFVGRSLRFSSGDISYPVFAFSGLILWLAFSSGIINAGNSMIQNSQIIKKVYFPRLIIPMSAIIVSIIDFLVAFVVFIALLIFYQQNVGWSAILYWPLALLLTIVASLGLGCLLAALNIKYRDFRYAIPFGIQALLFLSPVIYPVSILESDWMQYVLAVNPMYAAIILFRLPLTTVQPSLPLVYVSITSGLLLLIAGLTYFKRTETYFADLA